MHGPQNQVVKSSSSSGSLGSYEKFWSRILAQDWSFPKITALKPSYTVDIVENELKFEEE